MGGVGGGQELMDVREALFHAPLAAGGGVGCTASLLDMALL